MMMRKMDKMLLINRMKLIYLSVKRFIILNIIIIITKKME